MKVPEKLIRFKLREMINADVAPGFQLVVGFKDRQVVEICEGLRHPIRGRPVRSRTLFDLASLTKVIATASLIAHALQKGRLQNLDQKLGDFFPSLKEELREIPLKNLLLHISGLPPIFEATDEDIQTRDERVKYFFRKLDELKLGPSGKEVYSDIGFMLLGLILEQLHGKRMAEIFKEFFPTPSDLRYGPIEKTRHPMSWILGAKPAACPSLTDPKDYLVGQVQDPRAAWLMGDAGHAGLFGSASSVDAWGKEIYMSYFGKGLRLSDRVVRDLLDRCTVGGFRGGFDRPSGANPQAGLRASKENVVGHMGYTGASFWMDLEKGWRVTLLSHRKTNPETLSQWRPKFHDWLHEELLSKLES